MSGPLALPLGLQQICTEFGAPTTTPLLSMLKGGAYVPSNVPGGSIPSAPPIGILQFVGSRHVAKLAVDSSGINSVVNGLTLSSVTPNSDCSLVTVQLGGTFSNAHNSFAGMSGQVALTMRVDFVDSLTAVTIELPPGQTIDGDGYYELYGATQFRNTVTPAGSLTPGPVFPGLGQPPDNKDVADPYTGALSIGQASSMLPTRDNAARALIVQPGNKFVMQFPYLHQISAGSGSASKSWQSSSGGVNTFIEFPVRFKFYDSAGFNAQLDSIFHIEANTTTGFTLP
jgi:hypothetical protein